MKVVVFKPPRIFGGFLRFIFGIKKDKNQFLKQGAPSECPVFLIVSNISACTIIELDKQAMKARNFNGADYVDK